MMPQLSHTRSTRTAKFIAPARIGHRRHVWQSKEGLDVAKQVRQNLDGDDVAVYLWDQGTFGVSEYPISSLEDAIERADFTIAVARADDLLVSRGAEHKVPRDNVHFEYGISVGRLGRERSFRRQGL